MKGLYQKYIITKSDGSEVDHDAEYFVLRIDNSDIDWQRSAARTAAQVYAMLARNGSLLADLGGAPIEQQQEECHEGDGASGTRRLG